MPSVQQLAKLLGVSFGASAVAMWAHRVWKLHGDQIQNPYQVEFLKYAEKERRQGKTMFSPWVTENQIYLDIAQTYLSEVSLPTKLTPPFIQSVKISSLKKELTQAQNVRPIYVAVGGPSAAVFALNKAMEGKQVLYVNNKQFRGFENARAIFDGAANHGEPDAHTQGPAYTVGHTPSTFFWNEIKNLVNPPRYDKEVLSREFSWLNLNIDDWLINPGQWPAGMRVMWGNYQLAKIYQNNKAKDAVVTQLKDEMNSTAQYIEALNYYWPGILRKSRGSLIAAFNYSDWQALRSTKHSLFSEGRTLQPLTPEQAKAKYGFVPQKSFSLMEKTHDFIFAPDFMQKVEEGIEAHGGYVIKNWQLTDILIDTELQKGGVLKFIEKIPNEKILEHTIGFKQAHISLGATQYHPQIYPMISVTGVSINALLLGPKLPDTAGPIVLGGSNHFVPLTPSLPIQYVNEQGKSIKEHATLVRITAAASVGPLNRGKNWYTFPGRAAVHALHVVRENLPPNAKLVELTVNGCNRVIGSNALQTEIHPEVEVDGDIFEAKDVRLSVGSGGGGLSQIARSIAKNPNAFFVMKLYQNKKPMESAKLNPSSKSKTPSQR